MTTRRSRCTSPRSYAMTWVDARTEDDEYESRVVAWLGTLMPVVREQMLGDIAALQDLAAMGEIIFDPDAQQDPNAPLKPIVTNPEIYELRWTLLAKKLRQYHGEPGFDTDLLVKLRAHFKGDGDQQAHIEQAVEIYDEWLPAGVQHNP